MKPRCGLNLVAVLCGFYRDPSQLSKSALCPLSQT